MLRVPLHLPAPHRRPPPALALAHPAHRLALLADGAVGGERVLGARYVHAMQRAFLLQPRHLALHVPDRDRARRMGERGGQQAGPREHRLALGEMRHRPGDGFPRGRGRGCFRGGFAFRPASILPPGRPIFRRCARRSGCPVIPIADVRQRRRLRLPRPAGLGGRFHRPFPFRRAGPFNGTGHQRAGIEAEIGGLALPDAPEFLAVDVAFLRPRHQRGPLRDARIVPGNPKPALLHRRLDLGAAARERLDGFPGDPRDLETPVGMGLLDAVTQVLQPARELRPVERAQQHLGIVELLVRHRAPFAVLPLHHVGEHGMGVKLRIEVPRGVVPERGGDDLLVAGAHHAPGLRVLHAGLGRVPLDPVERRRDGAVVDVDDTLVAADQGGEGDGFRGGEGEVAAGTVEDLAVLAAPPELGSGPVWHLAFEHRAERVRIHGPP